DGSLLTGEGAVGRCSAGASSSQSPPSSSLSSGSSQEEASSCSHAGRCGRGCQRWLLSGNCTSGWRAPKTVRTACSTAPAIASETALEMPSRSWAARSSRRWRRRCRRSVKVFGGGPVVVSKEGMDGPPQGPWLAGRRSGQEEGQDKDLVLVLL